MMPRSRFPARAAARQTSRPSVGFAIIRKWPAWAAGSSSRSERAKRGGSSIRLTKLGPSSGPRWRRSGGSDDSSSRAAVTSRQKPRSAGRSRAARRIRPELWRTPFVRIRAVYRQVAAPTAAHPSARPPPRLLDRPQAGRDRRGFRLLQPEPHLARVSAASARTQDDAVRRRCSG
jgi:hypothetical protein